MKSTRPQCCPFCGHFDMRYAVEWEAKSTDPCDAGNSASLDEYQCASCSMSVWVGTNEAD